MSRPRSDNNGTLLEINQCPEPVSGIDGSIGEMLNCTFDKTKYQPNDDYETIATEFKTWFALD